MCHADVAAGHEEIRDIPAIETAIRRPIRTVILVILAFRCARNEFFAFQSFLKIAIRSMQVNMPGAGESSVRKDAICAKVIHRQHEIAKQSARLPFASNERRPADAMIGIKMIHVLQGIPGSIHRAQIQIPDLLHVSDGIFVKTALPKPASQILQRILGTPLAFEMVATGKRFIA